MPKAAAPDPDEWATTRNTFDPFELEELNRVVRDHAFIALATAEKRRGRSLVTRVCARAMFWIAALGICAPGSAIGFILSGRGRHKFSEDFSVEFETLSVQVASALGLAALLYLFLPWLRTPHRQWSRSVVGVSVVVGVCTSGLLALLYARDPEEYRQWTVTGPVWILLLATVAVIVSVYRLHHDTKPSAVDLGALTPEEVQALIESRRGALVRLRSRGIISYTEFDELVEAPLAAYRPES